MALRYELSETMSGTHHFVDRAYGEPIERRCHFKLRWGSGLLTALNPLGPRARSQDASGTIYFEGLTDDEVPCEGALVLDYPGKTLTYELSFNGSVKGGARTFRFRAEKHDVDLRKPLALVKTHTTAYGTLTDVAGNTVAKAVLHFELADVPRLLASLRVRRR